MSVSSPPSATPGGAARKTPHHSMFVRRPFFTAALLIVLCYVLAAIFAPWVAPYDPFVQMVEAMMQPLSLDHLLGTDSYGQDIFSRVIFGARYALVIGFFSVIIGAVGGLIIGLAAGLTDGWGEWALMRLIDSILALPSLILAVAFIAILGQGVDKVVIAVGLSMIGPFARTVRADVMRVRVQLYIEAAQLMSISGLRVIWAHVLPNVIFPLAVQVTIRISEAILVSSSLSFIGIGVTPPTPDWGLMIAEGRAFVSFAAWMSAMPGFALALMLIALSIVGDGIREEFDPNLRGRA